MNRLLLAGGAGALTATAVFTRRPQSSPAGEGSRVVILGGGVTGVELAAAADLLRLALPAAYPRIAGEMGRVILVEGQQQLIGHMGKAMSAAGVTFDGLPGWLAWRLVHLAKNTGFRNQFATVLDWTMGYTEHLDLVQLERGQRRV